MLRRRKQFALDCQQPTSNDIGLADIEVIRKPIEPLSFVTHEIDLDWQRFSDPPFGHEKHSLKRQ
jgi:hypothetical protein